MEREKLDTILANEEELVPSSGFLGAVMERVEAEAAAPAPLPFPWKRMIPGFVLAAAVLVWALVEMVRYVRSSGGVRAPHVHAAVLASPSMQQAGWVALALAMAWGAWILARRLGGREGML